MIHNMDMKRLLTLLLLIVPAMAHSAATPAPTTRPTVKAERVIVQVELMSSVIAATQPVELPHGRLPADAKRVSSARTLALTRVPFLCDVTNPGGLRTTLSGEGRPSADGHWRVALSYDFRSADGSYSGTTNIMLKPEQATLLGGTSGAAESQLLVMTLLPPDSPPAAAPLDADRRR